MKIITPLLVEEPCEVGFRVFRVSNQISRAEVPLIGEMFKDKHHLEDEPEDEDNSVEDYAESKAEAEWKKNRNADIMIFLDGSMILADFELDGQTKTRDFYVKDDILYIRRKLIKGSWIGVATRY